jgi:carboxyl-terminal processing protease
MRKNYLLLIALFIFAAGLASGLVLDRQILLQVAPDPRIPAAASTNFNLMAEAWNTIQKLWIGCRRSTVLPRGNRGMVTPGDTATHREPRNAQGDKPLQGRFEGSARGRDSGYRHRRLCSSPAQMIRRVMILGEWKGCRRAVPLQWSAKLGSRDKGDDYCQHPNNGEVQDLSIQRAEINVQNVTWTMLPGSKIAHIRIGAFSQGVTDGLQNALESAKKAGASGAVLDLRNDPGGLLNEAVGVASQFLKNGNVLLEKDAQGNTKAIQVQPGGVATDLPLVVLVNQGTASAAEIVSGALQDANRARLVGETTFGTGTVLNTYPLSDGSALLLATQEWLTPKGRVIWHQGIVPDVALALPSGQTILSPESERGLNAQGLQASGDVQLGRAIQILSGSKVSKGSTGGVSRLILTPLTLE